MKLFSSPSQCARLLFANIVTSLICSTAGAAVTAAEPNLADRCGAQVGGGAVARVAAVLLDQRLDPTHVQIEIPRRLLIKTSPKEEFWRVALRVRLDDGQVLERSEYLRFDDKCLVQADAITPQF